MKIYKPHPAAALYDMLPEAELKLLAADIKDNGQQLPGVVTRDGLLLDGRNRQEACRIAGVEFKTVQWAGENDEGASPTAYALSINGHRRHLTAGQRQLAGARAIPLFEAEAKARMKAGKAPVEETLAPRGARVGKAVAAAVTSGKAAALAAAATGASTRGVERMRGLLATAPAAEIEKIKTGEKSPGRVEREQKRAHQVAQVRVYQPPAGEFAVIVADPPWKYGDQLDGSDASRGGCPYPTMPLEEICALKPPAAADCVLWLWTTNAFLADGSAARVVKEWGFESKTILTWIKPRMGLGRWLRNITEHCIVAVRGSPRVDLGNQTTVVSGASTAHSAKPAEFFAMVEGLCPSPSRIEMFAREARMGWVTTGAELPPKREGWVEQAAAKAEKSTAPAEPSGAKVADPPPRRLPAATEKPKFPKPSPTTPRKRKPGPLSPMDGEAA